MNQTILKESYEARKKGKVKWQNVVPLQNPHNITDNIGLINY